MANRKERITLEMSTMDMAMAMSGGNPGALSVIVNLLHEAAAIDPDSALGGLGPILDLDTHGIYEDKIWMFYKDICGTSIEKMIGLQRAVQLGFMDIKVIKDQLAQPYAKLDEELIESMLTKVRERLPNFKG